MYMKRTLVIAAVAAVLLPAAASAQAPQRPAVPEKAYQFTVVKENPVTPVKNQFRSGTCWCFSTISFLESEVIRIKNIKDKEKYPDFSEMYVVSKSYHDRAIKFVRVDGKLGFSAGSEADDVLHVAEDYGLVPQSAMPGLQALPVHGELDAATKSYVEAIAKNPNRTLSTNWIKGFDAILDTYLGECPESFEVDGKTYTPATYRDAMGIVPEDYVTITSFSYQPYYKLVPIEVSDNWRWDCGYNVPLDEFMSIIYEAVDKGFTVAWGTDVSEPGFNRTGIGVLIDAQAATTGSDQERWVGKDNEKKPEGPVALPKELTVTEESRQAEYDSKQTTDDHGMHIFGAAKDQNGTKYFMVKNSWGVTGSYEGIWYCSDSFVRAKSMDVVVHKDALSKDMKKKLGIK